MSTVLVMVRCGICITQNKCGVRSLKCRHSAGVHGAMDAQRKYITVHVFKAQFSCETAFLLLEL